MAEQSGPFHLTETQLAQAVDDKTFHRAQPYVGEFSHRLCCGCIIGGRVAGPHGVYTASLTIDGSILIPCCTCTTGEEFCRHVVALGLTHIEDPASFYDLRTLTAKLEQLPHSDLVQLIIQMATRHPQILGMLGVEGFADAELEMDADDELDDELYDDEEDELVDDDDVEEEDFEEDEEVAQDIDVEAIYEEADVLLDDFQDYLRGRGVSREERARYDEMLQTFVDDYLAAYEVGKLTEMNRDEIDAYLQDYLLERERTPKRKLTDTKQALAAFYSFLSEQGHMLPELASPIIEYCQR